LTSLKLMHKLRDRPFIQKAADNIFIVPQLIS
jgi:hypothetical protein